MAPKKPKILVTGGCGYVGSHVTCQLSEEGYEVLVLDNLSTGSRAALLHGEELVVGDLGDESLLRRIFRSHKIEAIFHFAASIAVADSLANPLSYYENNTVNTLKLLRCAREAPAVRSIIFSSTAAVYGDTAVGEALSEDSPTLPVHPYGRSKLVDEWLLADLARVSPYRYVILRYFNVAGADGQLRLGQRGPTATHLIKIACEAACGKRERITIFGDDYATADGTCIRDYIHVSDLADAHLAALRYLAAGGESRILNCGYNRGYSVKEVLAACAAVAPRPLSVDIGPRRPGDVPYLVAANTRIRQTLDWQPSGASLTSMVGSALAWEERLATETPQRGSP